MSGPQPSQIEFTLKQKTLLEQMERRQTNPHCLVQRVKIILVCAQENNNEHVAQQLDVDRSTVRLWRERWLESVPSLSEAEAKGVSDKELTKMIETVLADNLRPGSPGIFTPEQIVQIVALACEEPQNSGRPISHWTPRELADEAIKRKIVDYISPRSVGRFLDEADLKPHLSRYWLNVNPDDPERFNDEVKTYPLQKAW